MVKRNPGASRSRERDYIPYGKPEEVELHRVGREYIPGRGFVETHWVETLKGVEVPGESSPDPTPRHFQGGLHPTSCRGKPGVSRVWERDGRLWCRPCYALRYGTPPPADLLVTVRRRRCSSPSGPSLLDFLASPAAQEKPPVAATGTKKNTKKKRKKK
jgi:hypothetical protein